MGSKALILIQGFAMQWYSGMSFKDKDACFKANMCMLLVLDMHAVHTGCSI